MAGWDQASVSVPVVTSLLDYSYYTVNSVDKPTELLWDPVVGITRNSITANSGYTLSSATAAAVISASLLW